MVCTPAPNARLLRLILYGVEQGRSLKPEVHGVLGGVERGNLEAGGAEGTATLDVSSFSTGTFPCKARPSPPCLAMRPLKNGSLAWSPLPEAESS